MSACDNCQYWRRIKDFQMGDCKLGGVTTSAGNVCPKHTPAGVAQARERVDQEVAAFDVVKAADKVMKAGLPRIDIMSVQAALRCQYRQAAEVVRFLADSGRVRKG